VTLNYDDLTPAERRVFVRACELDAADAAFFPAPEDLRAADDLMRRGLLVIRRTANDDVAFELSPRMRTADRLHRLREGAEASTN
jgi:hypothetical protein